MIAAIDTSVLIYLFDEGAPAPVDQNTGLPVANVRERVEYLVARLSQDKAKLIIPTPALAEILVMAGSAGPDWLAILNKSSVFKIVSFDILAAVEHAATQQFRKNERTVKSESRPKAKFDDQIVAISAVGQATTIYSDDKGIRKNVAGKFEVLGIADLPLRPQSDQYGMTLES